jgi:hypothetical protein
MGAIMNIQQELDSLFEKALALLHESIKEPDKQPERRARLCAWNKKFRAVRRAITASRPNSNSGTRPGAVSPPRLSTLNRP